MHDTILSYSTALPISPQICSKVYFSGLRRRKKIWSGAILLWFALVLVNAIGYPSDRTHLQYYIYCILTFI